MKILFLDDDAERNRVLKTNTTKLYTWVKTASECIEALKNEDWDLVLLDHDLGGQQFVDSNREDTGMEVVRWISENKPKIKHVFVHSYNSGAADTMVKSLRADYPVEYIPFGEKLFSVINFIKD